MTAKIISLTRPIPIGALHEQAAHRLRQMLVENRIAPGAKLNERELSDELNVSRTPLREAIKMLAAEGLVELLPGNTQVTGVQLSNIRSARQLRIPDKPPHSLGRSIQGFSKLVEYPSQWSQICYHRILVTYSRCVRLHGFVHSCL